MIFTVSDFGIPNKIIMWKLTWVDWASCPINSLWVFLLFSETSISPTVWYHTHFNCVLYSKLDVWVTQILFKKEIETLYKAFPVILT